MSSALRTPHQNTAGSFFIVTLSGYLTDSAGSPQTSVPSVLVAAGEVLIDLGHVVAASTSATGYLKKVARIADPLITGYVHLPVAVDSDGLQIALSPRVAKFQL
jgi:hypothetical protein